MHHTLRRLAPSRITNRRRRARTAILLAVAAAALSTTLGSAASASAAVYYEWESEKSALNLVMAAKGTAPGSKVGLATDNNSSMALWKATPQGDGFWSYKLRASEHLAKPVCLDVEGDSKQPGAAIVVRECDGTLSQNWRDFGVSFPTTKSHLLNEDSKRWMHLPNGPEFLVTLDQQTSSVVTNPADPLSGIWTWRSVVL
jgi:Ricin-type beta-trefoil lectin domain-like